MYLHTNKSTEKKQMKSTTHPTKNKIEIKESIDVNSFEFTNNKYEYYKLLREEYPVCKGKVSVMDAYFLSRYDDCVNFLKDPRFVRNRTTATGGGRFPFPMPKSVTLMANSMITEDEPDHRRLRDLVHQAFTRQSLAKMEGRIEQLTNDLLARSPNKHLGFGSGIHTCLGAPLARMETRIAITNLIKRNPDLRLAVDASELELINMPLWHRYKSLPVVLG